MEIEQIEERRYAPLFDCHREGDRSVDNMMVQIGYVLRIFFAGICGLMIGIERRNRLKEAGIRTHLIVALGSALMMIVSKYGSFDLQGHSFLRADASRIASQIVSGIGFLGAGMIIWHHRTVSGLTTAAGIWATAGIGMAIGAGLYGVGGACALLILGVQMLSHWEHRWAPEIDRIRVCMPENGAEIGQMFEIFSEQKIKVIGLELSRKKRGELVAEFHLRFPGGLERKLLTEQLEGLKSVVSIKL